MKSYIILTGSIYDMGGAEMFTSNKCAYLKSKGWEVRVFYFNKGNRILIDNLTEFEKNYIPELKYGYYYFTESQRKRIFNHVCNGLTRNDEIVIESHLIGLSYWAELISEHIGAKSILNCMEEKIRQVSPSEAAFLEYKVFRHEVLNGTPRAFQRYFGELYKTEYDCYENKMVPLCSNVVSESANEKVNIPEADFNLLSIGRLDKPYVQTMLQGVKNFVERYNQYQFNFLIIGGSPDGSVEKQIQGMFENIPNVKVRLLGYLFPVPAAFIRKADVGMASANSILVTADQGIPTISYDMSDYQTMGIYRYTTNNKFKRQDEPAIPTEILLEEILIGRKYIRTSPVEIDSNQLEKVFSSQVDFLSKSPNDHGAYDVMSIHSWSEKCIANLKRVVLTILRKW